MALRMGFAKGEIVLEVGYGPDCDDELRTQIKEIVGTDFLENSTNEVVDAVLLWFRQDDGDLVDELMDIFGFQVARKILSQKYIKKFSRVVNSEKSTKIE